MVGCTCMDGCGNGAELIPEVGPDEPGWEYWESFGGWICPRCIKKRTVFIVVRVDGPYEPTFTVVAIRDDRADAQAVADKVGGGRPRSPHFESVNAYVEALVVGADPLKPDDFGDVIDAEVVEPDA